MTDPTDDARSRRERWDERHATHDPIESSDPDPTLVETCSNLPPGRALDLGAGDGRNAIWLAQQGWHVTAVDFSRVGLDRARSRAAAAGVDVDWRLEDLLEWHPEPGAFDLVVLLFMQLPPDERRVVYGYAAAAVAPGGTLLVVGHDRSNLVDGVGGPRDPEVLLTAAELVAGLPPGLRVLRAEAIRRGRGNGPRPIDTVLLATRPGAREISAGRTG